MNRNFKRVLAGLAALCLTGCGAMGAAGGAEGGTGGGSWIWIIYIALFIGIIYFMSIRPQKKEKKKHEEMMNAMAIGDTVLTTAGFYGTIIDMTDDMVIVEFGNNKNCRIPMQKGAIVQIEKPEISQPQNTDNKDNK